MKKIYFVFSYTGTWLSRVVRMYTRMHYSHVSLALDINLSGMYSFGRLFPYIGLIGGFVHESKNYGTFKRFKNTDVLIGSITVTDEQYKDICNQILYFNENKRKYRFNFIGLTLVPFNIQIKRKNAFYCAEFVKHILDSACIENDLPKIVKPMDFLHLKDLKIIYRGKLMDYNIIKN